MTERLRIVVSGTVAAAADQGGAAWAVAQWVLGLRRLGHDAVLIEQVPADRFAAAAPRFSALTEEFGLDGHGAIVTDDGSTTAGMTRSALTRTVSGADLLLNISGLLTDPELLAACGRRAFLDLDPAFTQLWHDAEHVDMGFDRHDRFVTIGQRIGQPDCPIPTCGRDWVTTPQPIVLERWPLASAGADWGMTTVGHWRSYGSIHHAGVHYGQKAHSVRALIDLPGRCPEPLQPALAIHPDERDDLAALRRHGWRLTDPRAVAATPAAYRDFIGRSWAELGVAKLGYAASRCGWFSDRSVCYLACGRPVVAQDTGFGSWLSTGAGLFAFTTADQAAAAIDSVRSDYGAHRRAARALAEDVFDSDRVLEELLSCL
jgi:hypothetical protein